MKVLTWKNLTGNRACLRGKSTFLSGCSYSRSTAHTWCARLGQGRSAGTGPEWAGRILHTGPSWQVAGCQHRRGTRQRLGGEWWLVGGLRWRVNGGWLESGYSLVLDDWVGGRMVYMVLGVDCSTVFWRLLSWRLDGPLSRRGLGIGVWGRTRIECTEFGVWLGMSDWVLLE